MDVGHVVLGAAQVPMGEERIDEALAAVAELVEVGVPRRRAAAIVAGLTGVARNRLYRGSL